jgi:lipoprotein-anchoring transpeptidase ErfK/SrfK
VRQLRTKRGEVKKSWGFRAAVNQQRSFFSGREQTSQTWFMLHGGALAAVGAVTRVAQESIRRMRFLVVLIALFIGLAAPARAGVVVRVGNSEQRMHVYVDGTLAYVWPVSTARKGYWTPPGNYRVVRMERMWYSRKYDMSPMPHALFFRGGYAIHGTGSIRQLGRPASHGCVRLHPTNAQALFDLVRYYGGARILVRA